MNRRTLRIIATFAFVATSTYFAQDLFKSFVIIILGNLMMYAYVHELEEL